MLDKTPLLTVKLDSQLCAYDLRINDVPLQRDPGGLPMTVEIPVNHWVFAGPNTLSLTAGPPEGKELDPKAACKVTLAVRTMGDPPDSAMTITEIAWSADDPGAAGSPPAGNMNIGCADPDAKGAAAETKVGEISATDQDGTAVLRREVVFPKLPFRDWLWLGGEAIEDPEAAKEPLLGIYGDLFGKLSAGQWQDGVAMSSVKVEELAEAYFCETAEMEAELGYKKTCENEELEAHPFAGDGCAVEVFGEGRLARLVTPKGRSPVCFVYKDKSAAHYYDVVVCKSGDDFTVIR